MNLLDFVDLEVEICLVTGRLVMGRIKWSSSHRAYYVNEDTHRVYLNPNHIVSIDLESGW